MLVLTPEANAEVRRNLLFAFGLTAGALLTFAVVLAAAINPPGGSEGWHVASLLLMAVCLPVVVMVGTCLTLAYPLGCWPGFMRSHRLADLYGIDAEAISNPGIRRWMGRRPYWSAFAKGAAVGLVFVGPWFLTAWATSRKGFPEGFVFPCLLIVVYSGGLAARAWTVGQLVAECRQGPTS